MALVRVIRVADEILSTNNAVSVTARVDSAYAALALSIFTSKLALSQAVVTTLC